MQIARIMKIRGKNNKQLSEEGELAYNTILYHREGRGKRMDRASLEKIAKALDVSVWELFYDGSLDAALIELASSLGETYDPSQATARTAYGLVKRAALTLQRLAV